MLQQRAFGPFLKPSDVDRAATCVPVEGSDVGSDPGTNDLLSDLWVRELTAQRQFIVSATRLGALGEPSLAAIFVDLATDRHHDVIELARAVIVLGKGLDTASNGGGVYRIATASEAMGLAMHNDAEIDRAIVRYAAACRTVRDVTGDGLARRLALTHVKRAARVRRLGMRVERREPLHSLP